MLVRDIMIRRPVTISDTTPVEDARQLMKFEGISCLFVLNESGRLVGLFSELEMAKASPSLATTLDRFEIRSLLSRITVGQVMETGFIAVDEGASLREAAHALSDRCVNVLPVMRGSDLVGMVTEDTLLQILQEMLDAPERRAA